MKTFGDLLADLRHRIRNRFGETEASIEAVRGSAIGICVWTIRTMVIAGLAYGLAIGGFGVHGDSLAKLALYIVISGLVAFGANHLAALADLRPSGMPMLAIATLLSFNPIAVPLWAVEPSMVPFFYLVLIVVASFLSEWRTVAAVSGAAAVMVVLMASQNPWVMHKSGDSVVVACMVCGAIACLLVVRNSLFSSMLATTEKQVESAYTDVSRVRIAMANQRRETYTYEEFQRKLSQVLGYVEHSMSSGAADVGAGLEAAKNDIQSLADDLVEMRRYADLIAESSAEVPNFLRHDRVVRTLAENIESALAEMTRFGVMGRGIASDSSTLLTNLDEIRRQRAKIMEAARKISHEMDPTGEAKASLEDAAAELSGVCTLVDQLLGRVRGNAEAISTDADTLTRNVGNSITTLHGLGDGLRTAHDNLQNIGIDTQAVVARTETIEPVLRRTVSGISRTGQKISHLVAQIAGMLRHSPEVERHRRHPRAPYEGRVTIHQDGRIYESRAINVSESGVLMTITASNSRLTPGPIEMKIDGLGSGGGTLLTISDVGLHASFDSLGDDLRAAIDDLVQRTTEEFAGAAAEAAEHAEEAAREKGKVRRGRGKGAASDKPAPLLRVDGPPDPTKEIPVARMEDEVLVVPPAALDPDHKPVFAAANEEVAPFEPLPGEMRKAPAKKPRRVGAKKTPKGGEPT